uniref:Uncharacterized protein n=1 Tax=Wenling frogfish arenavirus 2 TaxID=2116467 RepID=A0A2P1GNR9_9VIRU|nr:hypothetical protein [Wenling frogfish arenavirus 2]
MERFNNDHRTMDLSYMHSEFRKGKFRINMMIRCRRLVRGSETFLSHQIHNVDDTLWAKMINDATIFQVWPWMDEKDGMKTEILSRLRWDYLHTGRTTIDLIDEVTGPCAPLESDALPEEIVVAYTNRPNQTSAKHLAFLSGKAFITTEARPDPIRN